MKKRFVRIAILTCILVGGYFATQYIIGTQVSRYIEETADNLIRHDDFQVSRIVYERGLSSGTLHYDLIYRPLPGSRGYELLSDIQQRPFLHLRGAAAVQHGPFLGSEGAGLARMTEYLSLPEDIGVWLPDYPDQVPVLTIDASSRFNRSTRVVVKAIDYQGRVRDPVDFTELTLNVSGTELRMSFNAELDRVASSAVIEEFALAAEHEQFSVALGGLSVQTRHRREMPYLWVGSAVMQLRELRLDAQQDLLAVHGLLLESDIELDQDMLAHRLSLEFASAAVNQTELGHSRLVAHVERLDASAYADYLAVLENTSLGLSVAPDAIESISNRLLASQPRLSVEDFSLSLRETFDTSAQMSLAYIGPPSLSDLVLLRLHEYFELTSSARISEAAVEEIVTLLIMQDYGDLPATQRAELIAENTQALVAILSDLTFTRMADGNLTTHIHLSGNRLVINDEVVPVDDDLVGLMMDLLLTQGLEAGLAGQAQTQFVALEAGFRPDPYELSVVAGGTDPVPAGLSEACGVYTTVDYPAVVLQYEAGGQPLTISASSVSDTALLVLAPDGEFYCNDDRGDWELDPLLFIAEPETGFYQIWLTTHAPMEDLALLQFTADEGHN